MYIVRVWEREREKGLCVLRLETLPQKETKNEHVVTNCRVSDAFAENWNRHERSKGFEKVNRERNGS